MYSSQARRGQVRLVQLCYVDDDSYVHKYFVNICLIVSPNRTHRRSAEVLRTLTMSIRRLTVIVADAVCHLGDEKMYANTKHDFPEMCGHFCATF